MLGPSMTGAPPPPWSSLPVACRRFHGIIDVSVAAAGARVLAAEVRPEREAAVAADHAVEVSGHLAGAAEEGARALDDGARLALQVRVGREHERRRRERGR